MNRFLLDTNVISEIRKPRPHGGVVAWFNDHEQHQFFVSAVSVGEIQRGIERTRRHDEGKAAELRTNVLLGVTGGLALLTAATALFLVSWRSSSAAVRIGAGSIALVGSLR